MFNKRKFPAGSTTLTIRSCERIITCKERFVVCTLARSARLMRSVVSPCLLTTATSLSSANSFVATSVCVAGVCLYSPCSSHLASRGDKMRKQPPSRAYFLLRRSVRPSSPTTSNQFIMSCRRRRDAWLTSLIFIHVKNMLYLVPLSQITQFAAEMKLVWVPVNLLLFSFFCTNGRFAASTRYPRYPRYPRFWYLALLCKTLTLDVETLVGGRSRVYFQLLHFSSDCFFCFTGE